MTNVETSKRGKSDDARPRAAPDTLTPTAKRRWLIIGAIVIVVATLLAYLPALSAGYIWDDDSYVTDNPVLRDLDGLAEIWIPGHTPQYYPLVFTTYWVEAHLWGVGEAGAAGFHALNVLLHIVSALLLWRVCRVLRIPGPWLIAAVFALHPVMVESVAWITERKNVLSLALYLTAALCYFRFDALRDSTEADAPGDTRQSPAAWYVLALLAFIGALLSKTVTASLPAALILALLWRRRRINARRLWPLVPMFIVGVALALQTAAIEREQVGAVGAEFDYGLAERIIIASRALLFYPWKMLWPFDLTFIYPRWEIDAARATQWLAPAAVAVIALGCVALFVRGRRGIPLALALFAGTVFPAIGFFNVYPHRFSFVADHFNYHSSIGLIMAAVGGVAWLAGRRWRELLHVLAAPILLALAVLTFRHALVFENAESVWRDTLSKNDQAWMPANNLAGILLRRAGAARAAGNVTGAEALAREAEQWTAQALAVRPDEHTVHANRSEALRLLGRYSEALEEIDRALELAPHLAENHWKKGRLLELLGRDDDALLQYLDAAQRGTDVPGYHGDAARLAARLNKLDIAAAQFRDVLRLEPDNPSALASLAAIESRRGNERSAAQLYRQLTQSPMPMELAAQVIPRYVRLLTTAADAQVRDANLAVQLAGRLVEMTGSADPAALLVLADALNAAGRNDDARNTADRAADVARRRGLDQLAEQIERRRQAY